MLTLTRTQAHRFTRTQALWKSVLPHYLPPSSVRGIPDYFWNPRWSEYPFLSAATAGFRFCASRSGGVSELCALC